MPISREKEQAEQAVLGAMGVWKQIRDLRLAYTDMTTNAYNAMILDIPTLAGVSRTDAVALMQVREDDLMHDITIVMDNWRRTP